MKKVVTIDFDFIMAPVIESYNNLLEDNYEVSDMIKDFPYMASIQPDLYYYDFLTQYISAVFAGNKCNEVFFIDSHEEIIKCLVNVDECKIVNIDHLHDVSYDEDEFKRPLLFNYNCGNWVKYLKDIGKMKEYTWICDENSVPLDEKHAAKYINHQIQFQDFKLLDLAEDTDMLIICKSGKWVPESIQILYYTWQNYFETIQKIKNIPTVDIND